MRLSLQMLVTQESKLNCLATSQSDFQCSTRGFSWMFASIDALFDSKNSGPTYYVQLVLGRGSLISTLILQTPVTARSHYNEMIDCLMG